MLTEKQTQVSKLLRKNALLMGDFTSDTDMNAWCRDFTFSLLKICFGPQAKISVSGVKGWKPPDQPETPLSKLQEVITDYTVMGDSLQEHFESQKSRLQLQQTSETLSSTQLEFSRLKINLADS